MMDSTRTGRLGVIVPTWKAERHWQDLSSSIALQGIDPAQVLIIDSSSPDNTVQLAERSGYRVVCIPQSEFGHGRTRQAATAYFPDADLLLYLTQDVVFDSPHSVRHLCDALDDQSVGAAYGRQLARPQADPIERHARLFNYPDTDQVRTFESRHTLGIRAAFLSNSFALYRRSALAAVGGFPADVIFGEDSYVAARLLMAGWKIAYASQATVIHSHPLTLHEEFKRYFDIGVHHDRESWLLQTFGKPGGEGLRFLRSELAYLRRHRSALIPKALLRTALKLAAYRGGALWQRLPSSVNRRLSTNPAFWHNR